jgi:tetratricopeptide (TPR) repeat protein
MSLFLNRTLLPLLLLAAMLLPARAAEPVKLKAITQQDDLAGTMVWFQLSSVPTYRMATSGQRIDLFFADTTVTPELRLPPEDGRIVKVLLAQMRGELMVSLLLRQVPALVTTVSDKTSATVQLEIFWEKETTERPSIAFRISGLPTRQENSAVSVPRRTSEYSGQWRKFFDRYQSPFTVGVSPDYSLPELPPPRPDLFPPDRITLLEKVAQGDWPGVLTELAPLASPDEAGSPFRLLRAEGLLRTGQARQALAILENFPNGALPPGLKERAGYLHSLALARGDAPYRAQNRLAEITALPVSADFRPHYLLLQGEIALITGDFDQALQVFAPTREVWPEPLQALRNLRMADALTELQRSTEALKTYRVLLEKKTWPENKLYSLNQAATAFFLAGEWNLAIKAYRQLADNLTDKSHRGQATYATALATYRSGEIEEALKILWQIRETFAGTESDRRARLKLLDQGVLSGIEHRLPQAVVGYDAIAAKSVNRIVREEALFKYSLALHLNGEQSRAIEALDKFRRDFAGGPLRSEAESLMAEILPPMIEKMIGDGRDLEALVLVEKNRDLLLHQDSNWPFLPSLAQAFSRLGLFGRGCKVYLYLLEKSENRPEAGRFYLPLVSLYFDMDEPEMVEKYSQRYLVKYPRGEDLNPIFLLRLKALRKLNRPEQAAELLKERNRPTDNQIELTAAHIFWDLGDYDRVISSANRLGEKGQAIPPEGLLLLAEAMRRLGRGQNALPLYQVLADDGTFGDQATFRCGEIRLADGQRAEALNLFRQLVEKGKDPLWQKLAADALEAERF